METHTFWNEIFQWQIYVGNKIDMGTPELVNICLETNMETHGL